MRNQVTVVPDARANGSILSSYVSVSNRNVVYRSVFTWQATYGYLSPQALNSVSQVTQLGTETVLCYMTSITVKWEILGGSEHSIIHGS
jgi:hypothetical protein